METRLKILLFCFFLPTFTFAMGPKGGSGGNISPNADLTVSSFTVTNRLLVGGGANISTFTATTTIFDDGIQVSVTSMTVTGEFLLPTNAAPRTNVTPSRVGALILNTGSDPDEVCVSTGTTITTWTKLADGTSACSN